MKALFAMGQQRGYVTYAEVEEALPPQDVSEDFVSDTMLMLSEMGIHVVEHPPQEE